MTHSRRYFADSGLSSLKDSLILLDIDGTIVEHDGTEVSDDARWQIRELISNGNAVYLISNNRDEARTKKLAEELSVRCLCTSYRKPDVRACPPLFGEHAHRPIVVIGDKVLTDGFFAMRLCARLILVKRLRAPSDPWIVRLQYLIDTIAGWIVPL